MMRLEEMKDVEEIAQAYARAIRNLSREQIVRIEDGTFNRVLEERDSSLFQYARAAYLRTLELDQSVLDLQPPWAA